MCVVYICKYYAISYKGLEHLQISISARIPGMNSLQILSDDYT